ncbi:DUF167 domain-containing protein [Protaetiibacter intestinalis]|uniref:DUF167 domain-containing protein n=1 Tax=Protaetiibacter intestinalis TaxID=2419774 RepID=A0A387B519_9MICO|nr:DUF167 domain-containing protein [Protaetiibacter intestinalis]AYF96838.1 DUF167 domain-containing protein [Protaetiibacter intestinalis]
MREMRVRVKPGSSKGPLVEAAPEGLDAELVVYVRERAVDGRANAAVERVVAEHLGLPPSRVAIVRGHTGRSKLLRIDG